MGYTLLYIAFGVVALWLLGEVLLQYKARLRWRLLAFAGFMGVVTGVVLHSVIVICLGAAAFATGQTFVTLSHRRGFTMGWAIAWRPAAASAAPAPATGRGGRRRKGARAAAPSASASAAPSDSAAPAEPEGLTPETDAQVPAAAVYEPMPLPDDTGEYGVYSDRLAYAADPYSGGGFEEYGAPGHGGEWQQEQPAHAFTGYASDGAHGTGGYDQGGFAAGGYGYGYGAPGGEAWEEPDVFGNNAPYPAGYAPEQQPYPAPPAADPYGYPQQPYPGHAGAEQQAYGYQTPPGDVWNPLGEQPYVPPQAPGAYDQPQHAEPHDPYRY